MSESSKLVSLVACIDQINHEERYLVSLNGIYVAAASKCEILIWPVDAIGLAPNRLSAHSDQINGLTFGIGTDTESVVLCSSDKNVLNVWTIGIGGFSDSVFSVRHEFGAHENIKLCPRDKFVALTAQNVVYIFPVSATEVFEDTCVALRGHGSAIMTTEFSFFVPELLITASEDKTYAAWNFKNGSLLYQSSLNVLGMYICIAMDPNVNRFAVGSINAQISIIHPPNWSAPQILDGNRKSKGSSESPRSTCNRELISMFFTMKPTTPLQNSAFAFRNRPNFGSSGAESPTRELLEWPPLLVLGFTSGIELVHALTLEKLYCFDFETASIKHLENHRKRTQIWSASSYSFMDIDESLQLWCLATEENSQFNRVNLLILNHPFCAQKDELSTPESKGDELDSLSMVASTVPSFKSPLRCNQMLSRKSTIMAARAKHGLKPSKIVQSKKAAKNSNQPVTFKEKIKSSGYGPSSLPPPRKMFTPQTDMKASAKVVNSKNNSVVSGILNDKKYISDADPPLDLKVAMDADATCKHQITELLFSPNGKMLAAASVNKIVHVFSMPLPGRGAALTGHNGPVRSLKWSLDSSRIVTASDDKTVRLWNASGDYDQILNIDSLGSTLKPGKKFDKEISWASFYYNDSLVLFTSGKSLFAYAYHIDMSKVSDIKTYENKCRFAKVHQFEFSDCASITSASTVNSFLSHYVFVATSAKNLHVYDMNHCKIARTFEGCQERAIHCIRHNEGSLYSRLDSAGSAESYNIFATSAVCDGIKLWDVRQKMCVRKFDSHYNKFYYCGFDWSPCGKYIATTSEDRCAYLYDVTASAYLHKYTKLSDIGTSASFHPLYPEVAFSFNDGKLCLFSSKDNNNTATPKRGGAKVPTSAVKSVTVNRTSHSPQVAKSAGLRKATMSASEREQPRRSAVQELL